MAIQTDYNYNGITVPSAYVRIERLWGSSREGWEALIGVYNIISKEIEVENPDNPEEVIMETIQEKLKITEFNFKSPFNSEERGYVTLYKKLKELYGGIDV